MTGPGQQITFTQKQHMLTFGYQRKSANAGVNRERTAVYQHVGLTAAHPDIDRSVKNASLHFLLEVCSCGLTTDDVAAAL
jgi:hypothetical protein